ncbi:MAG: Tol-Pal system protein TolB, partial [Rubrivivax sp.]|nr:Tol-Pal system protein TolB [Rubrivivax sp.]
MNLLRAGGSWTGMWTRRACIGALGGAVAAPALAQLRVEISGVGATQVP